MSTLHITVPLPSWRSVAVGALAGLALLGGGIALSKVASSAVDGLRESQPVYAMNTYGDNVQWGMDMCSAALDMVGDSLDDPHVIPAEVWEQAYWNCLQINGYTI